MREKEPTIGDVADQAGLSKATISRYLNSRISLPPQTTQRIEAAIASLGYARNHFARRLRHGKSDIIGLLVPEISNPFFAELAEGAESEAADAGYGLILGIGRDEISREIKALGWLDTHMVDGMLFASNRPDDGQLRDQLNRRAAVVILDEDVPGTKAGKVFCDNHGGAFLATSHLLACGHRRIVHVGGPVGLMSARERHAGYRAAIEANAIAYDETLVLHGRYSREFGREAASFIKALSPRPDAIFAGSDYIAIGLLEGLRLAGLGVPSDISIVGFDDVMAADMVSPGLTTVRQDAGLMGREGVRQLLAQLGAPESPGPVVRTPVSLTARASVARSRDPGGHGGIVMPDAYGTTMR